MTYSFGDITLVLSHPVFGSYTAVGEGLGSINISMANDVSVQDIAADGKVMTTKIAAGNGSAQLNVQQTSSMNVWLTKLYNYLTTASADQWERMTVSVKAPTIQQETILTRVSFQKHADKPYQQQGQAIDWNLLAAEIQHNAI